jgi:GntR family transcriptional regulator
VPGPKILYHFHIESLLRQQILTGQIEPGERIGAERDLSERFAVSRVTVRTALARLQKDGLLIRRRGKGTFVASRLPAREQLVLTGDLRDLVLDLDQYRVRLLGVDELRIPDTRIAGELRRFFRVDDGGKVHVIRRLRLLDGKPVIYIENFLRPEIARHLSHRELSSVPVQKLLREKAGIRPGRSETYFDSVPSDTVLAEALQTHVFAPLFFIKGYIWLEDGEPFEILHLFMRPEYFTYKVEMDYNRLHKDGGPA